MSIKCKNINPLKRSGISQYQRLMSALLPASVQVDERDNADLILFAKNYAEQLHYYNTDNAIDGTWSGLMSMDVSVTLASLIKTDVKGCFAYAKDILNAIKETSSEAEAQNYFKALFDFGFSIIKLLDDYYNALPTDFAYREILGNSIRSNFPVYLDRLIKYYYFAKDPGFLLIDANSNYIFPDAPLKLIFSQDFNFPVNNIWRIDPPLPLSGFTPSFNGTTTIIKIKNTATHNLFTGIFDVLLKSLAGIVEKAKDHLEITLTNFPTHSPHYALFVTFIKLFRFAQDSLNKFTGNHLDLYYKEILQLQNKPAEADKVHLTFELQKNISQHLLAKDTVFKAGKDTDGEEIFYALTEDIVINKGAVKSLKNIFVKSNTSAGNKQIFAGNIANSEDGAGAKIESPDKSWKTFGSSDSLKAEIGFAIASNYLYLRDGTRTITFNFFSVAGSLINFNDTDIKGLFTIQLTGEKGWVDIVTPIKCTIDSSKKFLSISFTIDGGIGKIVPYSEKIHQLNLDINLPAAKFKLINSFALNEIWEFSFSKINITADVSGIKDIVIQNDQGVLSTSKPFEMFGTLPHENSSFIIGHKELFIKTFNDDADVSGNIQLMWDNYDELATWDGDNNTNTITVDIGYLENGNWKTTAENKGNYLFGQEFPPDSPEVQPAILFSLSHINTALDYTDNEIYSATPKWGFLKLDLHGEFGHSTYVQQLTDAAKSAVITSVLNGTTTTTTVAIADISEPYTPVVKEITLNYLAVTSLDFSKEEQSSFIHITPFGSEKLTNNDSVLLLPPFNNEGELFIGIENFITDQTLSILFQVAEGTADPLATKQELKWYYLVADNKWIEFEKQDIADATDDLTNSGIIKFNISNNAVSQNTFMGEQLHWIKATVHEKTNAVCKLINIVAQAALAKFSDYRSTGNYFKNTLPASSISKLVASDAAIKKITQPYASFNGRMNETDEYFYIRVSERLRHKSRSISMWDYERMVLEQFAGIFKVKCINHTQILEQTSGGSTLYTDNELKPGYVLVIPIPDLQNKNAYDPLRPNTSIGLLTDIKKFLYNYISPHANLDVRNPRFEEIQLEFKVKFITEDNEFYEQQLKEEIQQYLAPWAFNQATDIEFGGKISKSTLIDFIEERPYVDFLSCVNMYVIVDGVKSSNVEEAIATSARSVFVSVKSDDAVNAHKISFITYECKC